MGVSSDGKWFTVEPLDMPVAAAAEQILAIRLAAIGKHLAPASREAEHNVETVHQLRVTCRRAAAALRSFDSVIGRGGKRLGRWLKRIRRAAGPARDADVLSARLRDELDATNLYVGEVFAHVGEARAKARQQLVALEAKAARGGFDRAAEKCLRKLRAADKRGAREPFAEFAKSALKEETRRLEAIDPGGATIAELHQLRIAAKRLRYSIEIFHGAGGPALRAEVYPQIEELQDRLGAINDHAAAQLAFQRWLALMPTDGLAAFTAGLIVNEHAAAQRHRSELIDWWSDARQSLLCDQLEDSLA